MPSGRRSSRHRPWWRRRLVWVPAAVLAVGVLAAGLLLARDAQQARTALNNAADQAKVLQDQITDGDVAGATATLASLQASTDTAVTRTDGPLWSAATALPFAGDSVDAVREISRSLDRIADDGMPPVVKVAASLDADVFKPVDGRIDLGEITRLAPAVATSAEVLGTERKVLAGIDADDLLGALRGPVRELQDKIGDAEKASSSASRAMRLMPGMLGASGPRTYLLMVQNNAEVRATGGIPGAWALLTAEAGDVSIVDQGQGGEVRRFGEPVLPLTEDEAGLFSTQVATDFRNITFTPDFGRSAAFGAAMIQAETGRPIDGVISIDPAALALLLKGTGPVDVGDGTVLTDRNAVDVLLNEVYARFPDPRLQDAFFAVATTQVFDRITSGAGDAREVVEALVDATDEGRIMVWSARPEEAEVLAGTRVAGALPVGEAAATSVGVYLNDSTESKMQYYLDVDTRARSVRCTDDGVQTIEVTTTFTSTAPADAAALPRYITGGDDRTAAGSMLLNTYTFAPDRGEFVSLTRDGEFVPLSGVGYAGRPVTSTAFTLDPGQTVTLVSTMRTGPDARGDVVVTRTPGVRTGDDREAVADSC